MIPMVFDEQEDIPADWSTLIRLGTILEVDLAAARCVVRFGNPDDPDGGARTPPIRWLALRAGETRAWSPPSVGEQVLLLTPDGQLGAAVALAGMVQDAFPPPGNSSRELLRFADGAEIAYDPRSHRLEAILPAGGTATIEAPGGITLRGDVAIEGELTVSQSVIAEGDVTGGSVSLKDHRHSQVKSGAELSGKPG